MEASVLLATLRSRGFVLRWDGAKIKVIGPTRVPDELASVLRVEREQVIKLLKDEAEAATASEPVVRVPAPDRIVSPQPCRVCGGVRLWRLPEVTRWWCEACLPCLLSPADVEWSPPGTPPLTRIPLRSPSRG